MSESIEIKPISIKAMGRAQMACLRCRTQKMKCSKDHPSCKACVSSNKDCRYPAREKKIVLLDSQFQKIQARIKFLENELREVKAIKPEKTAPKETVKPEPPRDLFDGIEYQQLEEYIDPFDEEVHENDYFGTGTCQMFDSSLNSFLFKFTHKEDDSNNDVNYVNQNSRFFLEDSAAKKPFSGVLMLPDKEYSVFLIQKVISFLGHEYFFVNPEEFLSKVNDTYETFLDRDPTWLCYLLITLAVGEQFLNESSDGDAPGMRFFISALQIFRDYYENPSLELIQTLLLFAFYQQGLNRINSAFSFYGLAMRNALMMGLHRKVADPNVSVIEREKRKRVWWTIFVMDSIWCAKISQPIHVLIEDVEVELPNVNFVSLNDEFDPELLTHNVKLGVILGKIMKNIYRPNTNNKGINLKYILECIEDLDSFQNSLPDRIKNSLFISSNRSVANLYLRLNQAVIISTRPLVLSIFKGIYEENKITRRVVQKCTIAAKTTIDMLINLKNNGWFSTFGFWDAQYCFSSLLILVMSSLSGHHFPQIEIGRKINGYMKKAGNFTALENDMRIKELDYLLAKVNEQKRLATAARRESHRGSASHGLNGHESNGNLLPQDDSPVSALMSEITDNFSAYNRHYGISPSQLSFSQPANGSESEFQALSLDQDSETRTIDTRVDDKTLRDARNATIASTDESMVTPENANVFKDDFSPDTWNTLVLSLQIWDSSHLGNSMARFQN